MAITDTAATAATGDIFAALNGKTTGTVTQNEAGSADRFLKLLVAQMQNQDPLNPLDNAQVTTQMAQINTVDGISKLNENVQALGTQFVQFQALQGAALVGREVSVSGDRLLVADGHGGGGFELASSADRVRVEVLTAAGRIVTTQELGARSAGRHSFEWPSGEHTDSEGLRFRVVASSGSTTVTATPLMLDRVLSVSANGSRLELDLERKGIVGYADIESVH